MALLSSLAGVHDVAKLRMLVPLIASLVGHTDPAISEQLPVSVVEEYAGELMTLFDASEQACIADETTGAWAAFSDGYSLAITNGACRLYKFRGVSNKVLSTQNIIVQSVIRFSDN